MPSITEIQKEIIAHILKKGILITESISENLENELIKHIDEVMEEFKKQKTQFLEELTTRITQEKKPILTTLKNIQTQKTEKEMSIINIAKYYQTRYERLRKKIIKNNQLKNTISISKITNQKTVTIIGLIKNLSKSKNLNTFLTLEDPTGEIKVVITKKNPLSKTTTSLVEDEVIGISGGTGEKVVFGNEIFFPGAQLDEKQKNIPKFSSLQKTLFISRLNAQNVSLFEKIVKINETINEQKIQQIILLSNGINKDEQIAEQYKSLENILSKINGPIHIVPCNKDATTFTQRHSKIFKEFAKELYANNSITPHENPARIKQKKSTLLIFNKKNLVPMTIAQKQHLEPNNKKIQIPIENKIIDNEIVFIPSITNKITTLFNTTIVELKTDTISYINPIKGTIEEI